MISLKNNPLQLYLNKQNKSSSLFDDRPSALLKLVVVIPAYKETNISATIESLYACDEVLFHIEILVFINGRDEIGLEHRELNEQCYDEVLVLKEKYSKPTKK